MKARYQNSAIGKFISIDPAFSNLSFDLANPQSLNSYSYSQNNPIVYVDKNGESALYFARVLANYVMTHTPNIPHSIRQLNFTTQHPVAAVQIGPVYDGSRWTQSSHASNFAVNMTYSEKLYGVQTGEGTIRNALRHAIWQGILTKNFGSDIAEQAGNSHEYNPLADLSVRSFSESALADQTADLLNNEIGRNIALENLDASAQGIAMKTLDYSHQNGLYTVQQGANGMYNVVQTKITDAQYQESSKALSKLNNSGLSK